VNGKKGMKKIAIAWGIIMSLVFVSVMAALPVTARDQMFAGDVPCTWLKDEGSPIKIDPTMVNFSRTTNGDGYVDSYTTVATQTGARGIKATLKERGSGRTLTNNQKIYIDAVNSSPVLSIDTDVNKFYAAVAFMDSEVTPDDRKLSGMTCTRNYAVGASVCDRYSDTEDRIELVTHRGTDTVSSTLISTETIGTQRLSVTVKDPEDVHHTILWSREILVGDYTRDINVTVQRYTP
jgi:hypothetical protein